MNRIACTMTAAALLLITGSTVSAAQARAHYAEDKNVAKDREAHQPKNQKTGAYAFHTASDLIGENIINSNGETIASVEDFIADRGDGRITHVLIKSGDVLGIGGKTVAVPYDRLRWGYDPDDNEKALTLDMTNEQIERAAEFVPENWADLQHVSWTEKMDNWFTGETNADDASTAAAVEDAYSDSIRNGRTTEVRGTITRVDRTRGVDGSEEVMVTVRDKDGRDQKLVLGPSWYVMSQDAAPMRGQAIEAEAVPVVRDNQNRQVVLSAEINDRDLNLRNDDGRARWNVSADERRSIDEQGHGRLVLVSDVLDADVRARGGEDAGDVSDALIECRSGRIAALSLDPDENFLGIADEKKLVPWTLVSVTNGGNVHIDADKTMITAGQTMPEDLSVYNTPTGLEPVYAAYRVDPYTFEPRDGDRRDSSKRDMKAPQDGRTGAWGHDSRLLKQFRDGERATVTGKVTSIQTASIDPGVSDARVIVVTTDAGERRVVVGPSWYIDRQQNLTFKEGDRVTITGKKAMINGTEYIAASKVQNGSNTVNLWDGDNAAWNAGR